MSRPLLLTTALLVLVLAVLVSLLALDVIDTPTLRLSGVRTVTVLLTAAAAAMLVASLLRRAGRR